MMGSIDLKRAQLDLVEVQRSSGDDPEGQLKLSAERQLLMLRVLTEIAMGHHDPRALAEACIVVLDRAATMADGRVA